MRLPGHYAPWQVAVAVVVLVIVLGAAVLLATVNPLAPIGLVAILGATARLLPNVFAGNDPGSHKRSHRVLDDGDGRAA